MMQHQRDALNSLSASQRFLAAALSLAGKIAGIRVGPQAEAAFVVGAGTSLVASYWNSRVAGPDPPDPSFTTIVQPVFRTLPPIDATPSVFTQEQATAFNAWHAHQARGIAV